MITFALATQTDVPKIREIAELTWPVAYNNIISPAQINYMLNNMYSVDKLNASIAAPDEQFVLVYEAGEAVGFAGIQYHFPEKTDLRLHKLYVIPEMHGKHLGKELLLEVERLAKENRCLRIHLNVNKNNPAIHFYEKNGFEILEDVVLDIGNGFVMDDFVMIKQL